MAGAEMMARAQAPATALSAQKSFENNGFNLD
jgi:hypothetical protein